MRDLDVLLFSFLAGGAHPNPIVLSIATAFANGGAWAAACVLLAAAWFHPRARFHILGIVIASSIAALLSHYLAAAFGWPRPFALGLSPAWVAHGASGAFPSTHATVMATVAFLCLGRRELKMQATAIFLLTLATGWGRIYTGIHFPLDIAAGIGLGLVLAVVFNAVNRTLHGLMSNISPVALRAAESATSLTSRASVVAHPGVDASANSSYVARPDQTDLTEQKIKSPVGVMQERQSISCVIPCFNEDANLDRLLAHLKEVLDRLHCSWEVIVVDDGSRDETAAIAQLWCELPGFRLLALSRNFGKEAAMTAGLQASRGDCVVMLDGDLQHSPDLISQMVSRWKSGADMVYGVRQDRGATGWGREQASRLFYGMMNTSRRYRLPRDAGDFRLMDRRVVDALLALPERTRFMKGLYAWVGFESVALAYTPAPRLSGESSFGAWRLVAMALDGLTAFTTWPLRAVSISGVLLAICAFAYGSYLIIDHLVVGNPVSGWTTIVVSLMFFAGIQLISTGIVGEYIGRIFDEVKARPLYLVRGEAGSGLSERKR